MSLLRKITCSKCNETVHMNIMFTPFEPFDYKCSCGHSFLANTLWQEIENLKQNSQNYICPKCKHNLIWQSDWFQGHLFCQQCHYTISGNSINQIISQLESDYKNNKFE
jgi:ribosomal protein L37AE/L43A